MHIPAAPTGELSILPFRQALETSGLRGDFDADRWLYVPVSIPNTGTFWVPAGRTRSHRRQPLHRRAGRLGQHP